MQINVFEIQFLEEKPEFTKVVSFTILNLFHKHLPASHSPITFFVIMIPIKQFMVNSYFRVNKSL